MAEYVNTQNAPSGIIDTSSTRQAVDTVLEDFLTAKGDELEQTELALLPKLVAEFLLGGKRIRPLLTVTGWHAAGGEGASESVLQVAASLELFHTFALIHDDIMDESHIRRGRPAMHRLLAEAHPVRADEQFGARAAILVGDLVFSWSDELLHTSGLTHEQLGAASHLISRMRTEVMLGQYLDLRATGELTNDVDATLSVSRLKTAKYTVERPLHIGAALAGAGPKMFGAFTAYAIPLGEAFQLRDDLLGVYGDVGETGKSRLDDLRAGKSTTLVALALRHGDAVQTSRLRALLGNPRLDERELAEIFAVFAATGAADAVERMIEDRHRRALQALEHAPFTREAIAALQQFADTATWRNS